MTVLVGADPEVFVKDAKGRFRSAHGLVPGTKEAPHPVKDGAIQVDGLALEFNIKPARSSRAFVNNISSVLSQLADAVPKYEIVIEPTAIYHGNHMRAQPEEALELGCEPDFNAYTEAENPRPDNNTNMRTAAGHVHIGFTNNANVKDTVHFQKCITLVKHLDAFLGHPSLIWDNDQKRRSMYGKAGCFRPKPYGVEYRTLSNMWLKDKRLMAYVFNQVQRTVAFLQEGHRVNDTQPWAINSGDRWSSRRFLEREEYIQQPPAL